MIRLVALMTILLGATADAQTVDLGRDDTTWPDLSFPRGTGLRDAIHAAVADLSDNTIAHYHEETPANASGVPVSHNLGVAIGELTVTIYTGVGSSKVLVADPVGSGWTITETSDLVTTITPPSSIEWSAEILSTGLATHEADTDAHGASSALFGIDDSVLLKNKDLEDSTTEIVDDGDNTKKLQFQVSGLTTATTRTITMIDEDLTVVGTTNNQTLTNKVFDANNNTASNFEHGSEVDDPTTAVHGVGAGTVVGTTLVQTLTDKTLSDMKYDEANATIASNTFAHGTATVQRITSGSGPLNSITGAANGDMRIIVNELGAAVTVANDVGADGFLTGTGADIDLADDASLKLVYDTGAARWNVVGGSGAGGATGGGGINHVSNPDMESNINGWAFYDDGASGDPVDGTGDDGGRTNNLALSQDTTSKIRGTGSLKLARTGDSQGQGASTDMDIDATDANSLLKLSFDFDNGCAADDFDALIIDDTGGTPVQINPSNIEIPAGTGTFDALFVTSDQTDIRLVIHSTVTTATSCDLFVDNVRTSPVGDGTVGAVPVTEWEAYTPTLGGGSPTTSYNTGWFRRLGDSIQVKGSFTISAAGSSTLTVSLPTGHTIDSTKTRGVADTYGTATWLDDSTSPFFHGLNMIHDSTTTFSFYIDDGSTAGAPLSHTQLASPDRITYIGTFPISEFAGETVSMANSRVEYAYNTSGITAAGASDTTAFAYGPEGAAIGSIASTTAASETSMRVQFQGNTQATDTFIVQINNGSDTPWVSVNDSPAMTGFLKQGTSAYGIGINPSGDNTVDVKFGNQGRDSSNATYAGSGNAWADISGYKWRVAKSSNPLGIGTGTATETQPGAIKSFKSDGDSAEATFESGTWTPTFTHVSGPTYSRSATSGHYIRVGNLVFFTLRYTATGYSGTGRSQYRATLPIASDLVAGSSQGNIVGQLGDAGAGSGVVLVDVANDELLHDITFNTTTNQDYVWTGSYIVQ